MQVTVNKVRLIVYSIIVVFVLLLFIMIHVIADNRPNFYVNCTDAKAHHDTNIPIGSRYYRPQLDRNSNGIACES